MSEAEKKLRVFVSPELADGASWALVDPEDVGDLLREHIAANSEEDLHGETVSIRFRLMTDAQVERLPDL